MKEKEIDLLILRILLHQLENISKLEKNNGFYIIQDTKQELFLHYSSYCQKNN